MSSSFPRTSPSRMVDLASRSSLNSFTVTVKAVPQRRSIQPFAASGFAAPHDWVRPSAEGLAATRVRSVQPGCLAGLHRTRTAVVHAFCCQTTVPRGPVCTTKER
jgi:hypothetical protein